EMFFPLVKDATAAKALDLTLGYRYSKTRFKNIVGGGDSSNDNNSTYKVELSWLPVDKWRVRASYQRALREPNFNELFDGGGSNPQYYDPCSAGSAARAGANAAKLATLCAATGAAPGYVQTPGTQVALTLGPNTLLQPEKADTYTIGAVWQPEG